MRSMNDKDSPVNLTDEMKASSQRRFEMKSEVEVDKTAKKRKNTRSRINAYKLFTLKTDKSIPSVLNSEIEYIKSYGHFSAKSFLMKF